MSRTTTRHLTRLASEFDPNSTECPMGPQEHKVERRLAAIFASDVAGYSRLMEHDEVGTFQTLTAHRAIMNRLIAEYGGRIDSTAGDRVLTSSPGTRSVNQSTAIKIVR